MKKKQTVKLSPGDSVVVMQYQTLMYLAETCDILAGDQASEDDADSWRNIADEIRFQCTENHFEIEDESWV